MKTIETNDDEYRRRLTPFGSVSSSLSNTTKIEIAGFLVTLRTTSGKRQKCAVKKEKYLSFLDIATISGGIHRIVSNVRADTLTTIMETGNTNNGSAPRTGAQRTKDWYDRLTPAQKAERVRKKKARRHARKAKSVAGSSPPPHPHSSGSEAAAIEAGSSNTASMTEIDDLELADRVFAPSLFNDGNTEITREQFYEQLERRATELAKDVDDGDIELDQERAKYQHAQKEAFEIFGGLMWKAYSNYSDKLKESYAKNTHRTD